VEPIAGDVSHLDPALLEEGGAEFALCSHAPVTDLAKCVTRLDRGSTSVVL